MSGSIRRLNLTISWKKLLKDKFPPEIIQLLQHVRPEWSENGRNSTNHVKIQVLGGGYTNHMVTYYLDENLHNDGIVVRINGEDGDPFFNKALEIENIQYLHSAGRGPPLYAVFNNGVSYGFVNGVSLDENTVRQQHIQRLIAKEIVEFQKVQIPGRERRPGIWELFHRLHDAIPTAYTDPVKNRQLKSDFKPKDVLHKELSHLKQHLDGLQSPVVFCHNDLRPSNILYDKQTDKVIFIDVETAMYNNEHFEIGNHFVEYAGTENIKFNDYPDKEYQLSWLRYYLEQKIIQNGGSRSQVTDKDVESCYVKVNKFALAPNLGWALWGLAMAEKVHIEFDYLEYARRKFDAYFSKKEDVLSMKVP